MKKIILLALTTLMMVGCDEIKIKEHKQIKERPASEWDNQVVIIDSCEYISEEMRGLIEHKGNCRFCQERRQKEMKELIKQLKK